MAPSNMSAVMANEFCKTYESAFPHLELLRKVFDEVEKQLDESLRNLNENMANYKLLFDTMKATVNKAIINKAYDKTYIDNTLKSAMALAGSREARHENTRIALEAQIHTTMEDNNIDADLCIKASRYGAETYMAKMAEETNRMIDNVSLVPSIAGGEFAMTIEDLRPRKSIMPCGCIVM